MASKKDLLNTAKIRSPEERVAPTVKQDANVNPREDKGSLLWVDPKEIKENPFQPRTIFDENKHTEMVHSVKTKGIIQPLTVRYGDNNEIILIAGERRLRAALEAGLKEVPVFFRKDTPRELSLIENLLRDDLRPLEKAEGMKGMMEEQNYSQDQMADALGLSKTSISETLSLNNLPDTIKNIVQNAEADKYPQRVLVAIAKSGSVAKMNKLFKKYSANIISADEVRDAVKKKDRAVTSDPKILNNRISSFHQYIKRNVAQHNVEAVWNTLNDLNSSITDLLFLSEKKA